ncbi:c-type cytochrome [Litoribacter alkaliphilus]|uniref:C-type cytochrome n=1 Tax=Litoribacter ruber TaxID=702568 RepID=A0AAP2G3A7_9BACT|nr:cbb3-type cytochrome c oxidase N-terminal domain-containing protein [Litoribacter alkaliphilus]MBS9523295.1 c-type cytochrome [Litoribacter alkaliphilus]
MKRPSLKRINKGAAFTLGLVTLPTLSAFAQATPTLDYTNWTSADLMLGAVIFMAGFVVLALLGLAYALYALKKVIDAQKAAEMGIIPEQVGFWKRLEYRLTDAVPVEREFEVMTDHEYDDIRELDNSLPPWWKAMFYVTIVFAVFYMANYHIFGWGKLQAEEYEHEMVTAKAQIDAYFESIGGALNETNVTFLSDEESLTEGKSIYDGNCGACHGQELQGTVGPNLVDNYWIHGGEVGDIFKVIRDGVPSKGMISWKGQLSAEQIQMVTSYIMSKEGTEPANAKAPEGDEFIRQ